MTPALQERWRLTATWMNTMAAGFVVTGIAVPAIAWGYQAASYHFDDFGLEISASAVVAGVFLHLGARTVLRVACT